MSAIYCQEFMGTREVAEALRVERSQVSRWQRTRTRGFPAPAFVLAATPVWRAEDIKVFATTRPQRRTPLSATR